MEYTTNENTIYGNAAMLMLSAAMLSENAPAAVRGDVNADGIFTVSDVVMLQKWLIQAGNIINPNAGDLCEDNALDAFDLARMKRELLEE